MKRKSNSETLVIVPAAGFGRRVGSPIAKEMLRVKVAALGARGVSKSLTEPMIAHCLDLAKTMNLAAHVIVRPEKKALVRYLKKRAQTQELSVQIVGVTREWPDTLLLSRPFWRAKNIVCLPDTRFRPLQIFKVIDQRLRRTPLVWATFKAKDLKCWGAVDLKHKTHAEKPTSWVAGARGWGLFGFQKRYGVRVLESLLKSTMNSRQSQGDGSEWRHLSISQAGVELDQFQDLARKSSRATLPHTTSQRP